MVLELLTGPKAAEHRPSKMFLYGMLLSAVSVFISLWVFPQWASLMIVFLTTISCVYLIEKILKLEAQKSLEMSNERNVMLHHSKALLFFIFLFLGFTASFTLAYLFLSPKGANNAFAEQIAELNKISVYTGQAFSSANLWLIVLNNFKVLAFVTFFAFFYGAGVVFVLVWNASVIAVAIGNYSRQVLSELSAKFGAVGLATHFQALSIGIARYMTHGIFEIMAYFIAALAGGIISVAVINRHATGKSILRILLDGADLLALAAVLLLFAAIIEVGLTPLLF